jgi:hypothetical protein
VRVEALALRGDHLSYARVVRSAGAFIFATLFFVLSCDRKPVPGTIEVGQLSSLKKGPVRGSLTAAQIERLTSVQRVFAEVDKTPLPEFLEDFSRDLHPDREIAIWEAMAIAYTAFVSEGKTTSAERNEAYSLLLARSGAPTEAVLQTPLKVLTKAEAINLLSRYVGAPEPITVQPGAPGPLPNQ